MSDPIGLNASFEGVNEILPRFDQDRFTLDVRLGKGRQNQVRVSRVVFQR